MKSRITSYNVCYTKLLRLYRIGINTAKNYLAAMGRRAPTSTELEAEEAETHEDGERS